MKLQAMICPYCSAEIYFNPDSNTNFFHCSSCGVQIHFDDENTKKYNITYREIDDARIQEALAHERMLYKEIEAEDKADKRTIVLAICGFGFLFIVFLIFGILAYIS